MEVGRHAGIQSDHRRRVRQACVIGELIFYRSAGMEAFRSRYARGTNYLICPLSVPPYFKQAGGLEIKVCDPSGIAN